MQRRSGVERARRTLLVGTSLIVLGRLIIAALVTTRLPDRTIVESWTIFAQTGELARLGILAVVAAALSFMLALLGWRWVRRPVRAAAGIRRVAIVTLTLSSVFLVMTLVLPWGMALTAGGEPGVFRPDPFTSILTPAVAIPSLLLSGVVLGVRAITVAVAEDAQRNRNR